MPKYSVIVPVYNAEQYLEKCLDSVLSQSFKRFELILVDDGSTDNSGIICDEYAARDNRIKISHQKNKGVSSARNNGLKIVSGEKVVFIDADDYLSPDFLFNVDNADADFVFTSFDSNGGKEIIKEKDNQYHIDNDNDLVNLLRDHFLLTVWAKVYAMSIIKNNNISFDESLNYGEDTLFNNAYIKHIKTASSVSYIGYHHTINSDASLSQSRLVKPLVDRIEYVDKLLCLWSSNPIVQVFWADRYLWNVETELRRITNADLDAIKKKEEVRRLINHDAFKYSLAISPNYFNSKNKFLFTHNLYPLILQKYRK